MQSFVSIITLHFCVHVYPELTRSYQIKQARQEEKDSELEQVPVHFMVFITTLSQLRRSTQTLLICNLWLTNA